MKKEPEWKLRECGFVTKDRISHVVMLSKEDRDRVYELDMRVIEYGLK